MIIPKHYHQKNILIVGLGKNGQSNLEAFQKAGSNTFTWDDQYVNDPLIIKKINTMDLVVPSPGIAWDHPILQKARQFSIPIRNDLDLLKESCPKAKIIGITGTNGKSTTTALLAHILNKLHYSISVGGNLSPPILALKPQGKNGYFVLELSSYQLELANKVPVDIGILLNITHDHLNRHHTMENYRAIKNRIFEHATQKIIAEQLKYSIHKIDEYPFTHPTLYGIHNAQNIAACFAVCCSILNIPPNVFFKTISTFHGLPHRLQKVAKYKNITFINDSKATNPESTATALQIFENVFIILGGLEKSNNFNALLPLHKKIKKAYLIGHAAQELKKQLTQIPTCISKTLDIAIQDAYRDACLFKQKCVILLSPACTSFDQFQNFEQRGEQFMRIISDMINAHTTHRDHD